MSKEDLIAAIESRLDTIEGLLDELEDHQVQVESFRDSMVSYGMNGKSYLTRIAVSKSSCFRTTFNVYKINTIRQFANVN